MKYPLVSVIMPVRNEAAYIERSLGAVLGQEYPAERLEILVVDGMSDDGTREAVPAHPAADPRVRLLDKPARTVPAGAAHRSRPGAGGDGGRAHRQWRVPPAQRAPRGETSGGRLL